MSEEDDANTQWMIIAPRIYLDTCVLIDILLERNESNLPDPALENEISIAKIIYRRWPKDDLFISPFVIGEFLELGQHESYCRTEEELMSIVRKDISQRCEIIYAEEKDLMSISNKYSSLGIPSAMAFSMGARGNAIDAQGNVYENIQKDHIVLPDGSERKGMSGGVPPHGPDLNPQATMQSVSETTASAPIFEIAFFHHVAEIRNRTGINWKDAFHFYYAEKEYCTAIVTCDGGILKKSENLPRGMPKPMKPSTLKKYVEDHEPKRFFKDIFG
jgi:hypothetical protein